MRNEEREIFIIPHSPFPIKQEVFLMDTVIYVVKQGDTIFVSKPELKPSAEDRKIVLKKGERYVVVSGDTYANIAAALKIPAALLMEANGGFVKRLSVGDSLVITVEYAGIALLSEKDDSISMYLKPILNP